MLKARMLVLFFFFTFSFKKYPLLEIFFILPLQKYSTPSLEIYNSLNHPLKISRAPSPPPCCPVINNNVY